MSQPVSSNVLCLLCVGEISPIEVQRLDRCGHRFHADCLQRWFDLNIRTCPIEGNRVTSINGNPTPWAQDNAEDPREHALIRVIQVKKTDHFSDGIETWIVTTTTAIFIRRACVWSHELQQYQYRFSFLQTQKSQTSDRSPLVLYTSPDSSR